MKTSKLLMLGVLMVAATASFADPVPCDPALQTAINNAYTNRMAAITPQQDPSTYVDKNYNPREILSQDVTSGFLINGLLKGFNFGDMASSIINRGLTQVVANGVTSFKNSAGAIVSKYTPELSQNQSAAPSAVAPLLTGGAGTSTATPGFAPPGGYGYSNPGTALYPSVAQ